MAVELGVKAIPLFIPPDSVYVSPPLAFTVTVEPSQIDGLVLDRRTVGRGFTLSVRLAMLLHALTSVPNTVKIPVLVGVTTIVAPVAPVFHE